MKIPQVIDHIDQSYKVQVPYSYKTEVNIC